MISGHLGLAGSLRAESQPQTPDKEIFHHRLDPSVSAQANADVFQWPGDWGVTSCNNCPLQQGSLSAGGCRSRLWALLGRMQSSVPGRSLERKQQPQSLRILRIILAPWLNLQNADELEAAPIPFTIYYPVAPIHKHEFLVALSNNSQAKYSSFWMWVSKSSFPIKKLDSSCTGQRDLYSPDKASQLITVSISTW